MNKRILGAVMGMSVLTAAIIGKIEINSKNERQQDLARVVYLNDTTLAPRHGSEYPLHFRDNNAIGMKAFYHLEGEPREKELLLIYTDCIRGDLSIFTFCAKDYFRFEKTNFAFSAYALDRDGNKSPSERFIWNKGHTTRAPLTQ